MSIERRRNSRIQLLGTLHGRVVALDVYVSVIEISLGGMGIETDVEFPLGAVHEFQLTLGDQSHVHLTGRVVHCQRAAGEDSRYLCGIQFVEEPDKP